MYIVACFARQRHAQHFAHQGVRSLTLLVAHEQMTQSVKNGMPTRSIGTISVLPGTYLLATLAMNKSIEISFTL
ncbi:hypothetical protein SAMN05444064_1173 [Pseudomonas syringae]|uniref:hypothetical protein n=1 Tax=Pseudomonas syringae TaxID=317 RepID=UPI000897121B|nr:hypothetical protein [Pseudomonas syringae]SDX29126.1 hypothetical protein SAMN05444514_1173 [Pseudomonas syringae]SFM42784.1 hypothetical protein SAMN05444064_1173 [Pseudomonas syringae]